MTRRISDFWARGGALTSPEWARRQADQDAEGIDLDAWAAMPDAAHIAACEAMGFTPPVGKGKVRINRRFSMSIEDARKALSTFGERHPD